MNETQKKLESTAIASMVAGILGYSMLGAAGGIVAIICGHMARSKIKKAPEMLTGSGMALSGLIMGYTIIPLTAAALIFGIMHGMNRADVAVAEMQTAEIAAAVRTYTIEVGTLPRTLDALKENSEVSPRWVGPYYQGKLTDPWGSSYVFEMLGNKAVISSIGPDELPGTADDLSSNTALHNTAE